MNSINQIREALSEVAYNQQILSEGALADKMRENLKKKKAEWDEKGNKARKDGYEALDKAKKTQDDLEKSDFIQNVGESYTEYLASRIKYWCKDSE